MLCCHLDRFLSLHVLTCTVDETYVYMFTLKNHYILPCLLKRFTTYNSNNTVYRSTELKVQASYSDRLSSDRLSVSKRSHFHLLLNFQNYRVNFKQNIY